MKKYAVLTAKNISEDAENTLQSTFEFRAKLADELKNATSLKAEYDHLSESLANLRSSNKLLASEPSKEDIETERRAREVHESMRSDRERLANDEAALTSLDLKIEQYRERVTQLQKVAEERASAMKNTFGLYESCLGVSIRESNTAEYEVYFTDIRKFFSIKLEDNSILVSGDFQPSLRHNMRDPLGFCKMLLQAKELLRVQA